MRKIKTDLLLLSDYGLKEDINLTDVSIDTIDEVMNKVDWNLFHQLVLSRSKEEWLEVSGNIQEDGLSSSYKENEEVFVIKKAPGSVDELNNILKSYINNDDEFKKQHRYIGDKEAEVIQKKKYAKWHKEYQIKQKEESKQKGLRIFLAVIIFILLFIIPYYSAIGELQFIFQKTDYTEAEIVETKMHHVGKGYYMQTAYYEFEYEGVIYKDSFEAGKFIGKRSIGDIVKIKFSISNPNRSSMVEVYEDKKNRLRR